MLLDLSLNISHGISKGELAQQYSQLLEEEEVAEGDTLPQRLLLQIPFLFKQVSQVLAVRFNPLLHQGMEVL